MTPPAAHSSVLGAYKIVAFVAVTDPDRARAFYRDRLGLELVSEEPPFALVFDVQGIMLRLQLAKQVTPVAHTVLGWQVPEISAAARALEAAGVRLERFNIPGMAQDELGIWTAPGGAKVAWFKDPDGNMLSISQQGRMAV